MVLETALRQGLVELDGPAELVRAFPTWLALNLLAHVPPVASIPSRYAFRADRLQGRRDRHGGLPQSMRLLAPITLLASLATTNEP